MSSRKLHATIGAHVGVASSIAASAAGKALVVLVEENAALVRLLDGIAEAAPYLWDLVCADGARFLRLLRHDPDEQMAAWWQRRAAAA